MALEKASTYSFAGNSYIETRISALLDTAGYHRSTVENADVVFTYCLSVSDLEDLYYADNGLIQTAKKDAVLVDLSPSTVSFACELYAMGSVSDHAVLDAPFIVHNIVAPDAFSYPENISVVVGGLEEVFSRVEPMLRSFAHKVIWMGKPGSGQSAKIAATLSSSASLVGIIEAYTSFQNSEAALDTQDILDMVASFRILTPHQEEFLQAICDKEFKNTAFMIEHWMADLAAALVSVDDSDLILPQAESGFRLMELLAMIGGVDLSPAALVLVFADDDTCKQYGLDWSRAEGAFEFDGECDDHESGCECEGGHQEGHVPKHDRYDISGFMGFSAN